MPNKSRHNRSTSNDETSFTQEDRKQLKEINGVLKELVEEIKGLKSELECSKIKINEISEENANLKQLVNLNTFKIDALEQYGRRESIRIHGVPESSENNDDGEDVVKTIAKLLKVDVNDCDIQRAHRLGKKKEWE